MKVYTDNEGKIKSLSPKDGLTEVIINDENNPLKNFSDAKICCYKIAVTDGMVTMMTPYVDSRIIEHLDFLGKQVEAVTPYTETKTAYIGDSSLTFMTEAKGNLTVFGLKNYTVERLIDRIIITFDEVDELTDVTISIL